MIGAAPEISVGAVRYERTEDRTADLYAALLDGCCGSSGPRYKSRTVSSFV